jgi:tetratricopeptide (TPR) repeat protein
MKSGAGSPPEAVDRLSTSEARYDAFISYRRAQKQPVDELVRILREQFGLRIWVDRSNLESFDSSTRAIREGISESRAVIVWYSSDYPNSRPCQWELTVSFLAAERCGPVRDRVLVLNPTLAGDHIHPIELRDQNFQQVDASSPEAIAVAAEAVARHLTKIPVTPLGARGATASPPWFGRAPRGSNRFVGRLPALWQIHSALKATEHAIVTSARTPLVQIRGLGGMGKTLVVEEYALRFGAAFPGGVFWLNAPGPSAHKQLSADEMEAMRQQQFRGRAYDLGVAPEAIDDPRLINATIRETIAARLEGLEGGAQAKFLWVIDDIPFGLSRQELDGWMPPHPSGQVVFTTRSREHDAYGSTIDLGQLESVEALTLLSAHRRIRDDRERDVAQQLAADLGHHPLALELTGAALRQGQGILSFEQYRSRLLTPGSDALALATDLVGELPTGHEASISSTMLGSIEGLPAEGLDFLRLAAQLAPAPIDPSLVVAAFASVDALPDEVAGQRAIVGMAQCEARSLAALLPDDGGFRLVHALVSRVMRFNDVDRERQMALRDAAVVVLATVLPQVADARLHRSLEDEVAHTRHLLTSDVDRRVLVDLIGWLARFDYESGGAALETTRRYVELARSVYGEGHERTLLALGDLGRALEQVGADEEALEVTRAVVEGRTRLLGPEHPETLTAMNNLCVILTSLGDYQGARTLNEKVLEARLRTLGRGHPHTLFSLNTKAIDLLQNGDPKAARDVAEQVVEARRTLLGADHGDTLASMANLALILFTLGDYEAAERLAAEVLDKRTKILGATHPRTLNAAATLGRVLIARHQYTRARDVLAPARAAALSRVPRTHQLNLILANNLAKALTGIGDLADARPLQDEALEGAKRALGARHPLTLKFALNMYILLKGAGDATAAKSVYDAELGWLVTANSEAMGPEAQAVKRELEGLMGAEVRLPN